MCVRFLLATTGLFLASHALAWESSDIYATTGIKINRTSKEDVVAAYQDIYLSSLALDPVADWTGDVTKPGTTSASLKLGVQQRINYFRAMVGLPATVYHTPTANAIAQEAAYISAINQMVSHYPDASWKGYTAARADACAKSLLCGGSYGADAISSYIADLGDHNIALGHRRILLQPYLTEIGTGDIPNPPLGTWDYTQSNAIYTQGVKDYTVPFNPVAYPAAGYFPQELVPARWSYTTNGGDYSKAVVTMTKNGANVPMTVVDRVGWVGNGITWEPEGLHDEDGIPLTSSNDSTLVVKITGIQGLTTTEATYTVTTTKCGMSGPRKRDQLLRSRDFVFPGDVPGALVRFRRVRTLATTDFTGSARLRRGSTT